MSTPDAPLQSPDLSASRDFENVLVVHAHPDDETITTGGTLATLVAEGARVTVVTCTRGELGEVLPGDLAALRDDPASLAAYREGEIARAMHELGVTDHRYLGGEGARTAGLEQRAYRDSGMEWGPDGTPVPVADLHPAAFCAAEFSEIVSDLAAVVADVRPDAIVSYDSDGGYGHPDHVRVNRAALRAARLAGVPYFAIVAASENPRAGSPSPVSNPAVVIDGAQVFDRKVRALEAYRTQVAVLATADGPALEYPHGAVEPVTVVESFRHVAEPVADAAAQGPQMADLGRSGRALTYLIALVAGGLFGAIGTVAHTDSIGSFPLGTILSLGLVAALLVGFRILFDSRMVGIVAAIGVVVMIALLSPQSAGGSVLIPATTAGIVWTFGPTVIALVVLAWPRIPTRRDATPTQVAGDRMVSSPRG